MNSGAPSVLLALVLAASTAACATSPRYRDVIESRETPVKFSGYTKSPKQRVILTASCRAGQNPILIATPFTSDEPQTDERGEKWYSYHIDAPIPADSWCATSAGAQGLYSTYVYTMLESGLPLAVFASKENAWITGSVPLEDCYWKQKSMGGYAILEQCALKGEDGKPLNNTLLFARN